MTMGGGPHARRISFGGLSGPHARDLLLLVGVLFVTFSMQFLPGLAFVPELMRLSSSVWQQGMIWQLVTYPAAGWGGPSIWFLVGLLIFYMFANDLRWALGRQRFWNLLWMSAGAAALVACVVQVLIQAAGGAGDGGLRPHAGPADAAGDCHRRLRVDPARCDDHAVLRPADQGAVVHLDRDRVRLGGVPEVRRPRRLPRYLHRDRRRVRVAAAWTDAWPDARDAAALRALDRQAETEPGPPPLPRRPGRQKPKDDDRVRRGPWVN